jgi:hypothetical protein
MNTTSKLKKITKIDSHNEPDTADDRLMLKLARIALVVLLPVLGVLISDYVDSMRKSMDEMSVSIQDMRNKQTRLAVILSRVDTNVQNIEKRLDNLEPRKK